MSHFIDRFRDVEIGTYTSGGIDSSVINYITHKELNHREVQTFSVKFDDKLYDESMYQEILVKSLSLTPNYIRCNGTDIYDNFPEVIYHTEAPIFRTPLFRCFFGVKR